MKATPEQEAILEAVSSSKTSIMVQAGAGCGKTATLKMIAKTMPPTPALALAFNVSTKKNMEKEFPPHFQVKTLNGLGHVAWGKAIGKKLGVEERKLGNIITAVCKDEGFNPSADQWDAIRRLVTAAQHAGIIPSRFQNYKGVLPDRDENWIDIADDNFLECSPQILHLARSVLITSIQQSFQGVINYDDQIYMSALFGGVFPRFNDLLLDEAQDLSPLNHIQVRRCAAGRLYVVGDQKQSIYAFRGADHESIEKLRALRSEWIELPLLTTFRCPKVVVARQQDHVPGFTAWHTNAEGTFLNLFQAEKKTWDWLAIDSLKPSPHAEVAVICRNNAPLLSMAFKLLRQKIGCKMLGRDIGKGLISLSKKILPLDDLPSTDCLPLIQQWMDSEISLARANEKEGKVAGIEDRGECLIAVIESGGVENAGDLRKALEDLFSRTYGQVTLGTGHRVKGLEYDVVVHINPWLIPSKFALRAASAGNESQLKQEQNLKYVIETRSKNTLVLANLEDFDAQD